MTNAPLPQPPAPSVWSMVNVSFIICPLAMATAMIVLIFIPGNTAGAVIPGAGAVAFLGYSWLGKRERRDRLRLTIQTRLVVCALYPADEDEPGGIAVVRRRLGWTAFAPGVMGAAWFLRRDAALRWSASILDVIPPWVEEIRNTQIERDREAGD